MDRSIGVWKKLRKQRSKGAKEQQSEEACKQNGREVKKQDVRGGKHCSPLYDVWPTHPLLQIHRDLLDEECENAFRAFSLRFVMKGCRKIFLLCLNTTEERSDAGDL